MEWKYLTDGQDEGVVNMHLPLIDLVNLMGLFMEMGADSQKTCKNVYDFVIASDHVFLQLNNGTTFRFFADDGSR